MFTITNLSPSFLKSVEEKDESGQCKLCKYVSGTIGVDMRYIADVIPWMAKHNVCSCVWAIGAYIRELDKLTNEYSLPEAGLSETALLDKYIILDEVHFKRIKVTITENIRQDGLNLVFGMKFGLDTSDLDPYFSVKHLSFSM